jgi:predicted phage tail protein
MASFARSDSFAAQPNDFMRILAEQQSGNQSQDGLTLDPTMLAQLYGAGEQLREAAAMQAVQSIIGSGMATGSIAQALSPNQTSSQSTSQNQADDGAGSLTLRGRS